MPPVKKKHKAKKAVSKVEAPPILNQEDMELIQNTVKEYRQMGITPRMLMAGISRIIYGNPNQ